MKFYKRSNMPQPAQSLNLVGDGDEIYLLEEIEQSFNITFTQEDIAEIENIGQLYDVLMNIIPDINQKRNGCHTAKAFRLLLSSANQKNNPERIKPSTPLNLKGRQLEALIKNFQNENRFYLPRYSNDIAVWIALAILIGAPIATAFSGNIWLWITGWFALLPAICLLLNRSLPITYPYKTYGDIAKETAMLNYAELSKITRTTHPDDIWKNFTAIIQWSTGLDEPVGRETRFF